jgi:hypothetical protein
MNHFETFGAIVTRHPTALGCMFAALVLGVAVQLIVAVGRGLVTAALVSSTIKYIGAGTGATAVSDSITALSTEVDSRATGTQSQQQTTTANDTYRVTGTWTPTTARTITNAGVFSASSSVTLYSAVDSLNVALASSSDSIVFTFNHVYTSS